MLVDPGDVSIPKMYQLMIRAITPRPIGWVSTCSDDGIDNLAPFSFFNGVTANPPSVVFSPVNRRDGSKKDTVVNIEQNGQFVVNVVNFALAESMNQSSADYEFGDSEFEMTGLQTLDSHRVRPLRVAESPIQMECELIQIVPIGEGPAAANLIIGRILLMHIKDEVLNEEGHIDPQRVDAIGRMGGTGYVTTRDRFDLERPKI